MLCVAQLNWPLACGTQNCITFHIVYLDPTPAAASSWSFIFVSQVMLFKTYFCLSLLWVSFIWNSLWAKLNILVIVSIFHDGRIFCYRSYTSPYIDRCCFCNFQPSCICHICRWLSVCLRIYTCYIIPVRSFLKPSCSMSSADPDKTAFTHRLIWIYWLQMS